MVDLIDEIKEDLQQERLGKLWAQYGQWVLILAVLVVLATAGKVWWDDRINTRQETLGKQYYDAMDLLHQGKKTEAEPLFATIEKADGTAYPALAAFKRAQVLLDKGNIDEAITTYKTVIDSGKISPFLRELAQLLAVNLEITQHKGEDKAIKDTLAKLAKPSGVWRFSAQELQAAYALEQGDSAKALELYTNLSRDYLTPRHMKERAAEMMQALAAKEATSGAK